MFSLRPISRALTRAPTLLESRRTMVIPIKKALVKAGETEAEDVPALEKRMEEMAEKDPLMVFDSGGSQTRFYDLGNGLLKLTVFSLVFY